MCGIINYIHGVTMELDRGMYNIYKQINKQKKINKITTLCLVALFVNNEVNKQKTNILISEIEALKSELEEMKLGQDVKGEC